MIPAIHTGAGNCDLIIGVVIEGKKRECLVDTGAQISLLARESCSGRGLQKSRYRIRGIAGRTLKNYGETLVTLGIGNRVYPMRMQVVEAVGGYDGILGLDFLCNYKGVIDIPKGVLTLDGQCVELKRSVCEDETCSVFHVTSEKDHPVVIANAEYLPPRAERVFRVKVPREAAGRNGLVVIEPKPSEIEGCLIARTLCRLDDEDRVIVKAVNLGDEGATLRRGTMIASASGVEVAEIPKREVRRAEKGASVWDLKGKLDHLSDREKGPLVELLTEYQALFTEKDCLPVTNVTEHHIHTGDARPIHRRPYRIPFHQKPLVEQFVQEQLQSGVIIPSSSPWASPIVIVPKKCVDGSPAYRFCVDFRALNAVTTPDVYPLPNIVETLDYLGGCRYFTTLDMTSGYHQIPMAKKSQEKTAFIVDSGLYEYTRMPFGLRNAPASFQRMMDGVLRGLKPERCLVYLDDIIVFSDTMEGHVERLRDVFRRLDDAGLSLKIGKCHFASSSVNYLGHVIGNEGIRPEPAKIEAVQSFPVPTCVKELQSFLGLANYYRRFVNGFASIAKPLTNLLKKGRAFNWNDECGEAMNTLKASLTRTPVLVYPDFRRPFVLSADASNHALGAVLSQEIEGEEHPVAYASRTLNKAEQNYSATERELLAIIWATAHFRCYLYGRKFKIITDHAALKWLFSLKDPNSRLVRWTLKLSEYDYEVCYKPGKLHGNADGLSRKVRKVTMDEEMDIQNAQEADEECMRWVGDKNFEIADGLLCRVEEGVHQVVVPAGLRKQILKRCHDHKLAGHMGVNSTKHRVSGQYWWPGWKKDCIDYVRGCVSCLRRSPYGKTKAPLQPLPEADRPFQFISLDIVGPLPKTERGNRYVLSIIDHFSRYLVMAPLGDQTAETVSVTLVRDWILKFGVPERLLSDQGSNFTSELFQNVCRLLGIKKLQTSPFHPQCNGRVERVHRTIAQIISHYVNCKNNDWDLWVDYAVAAYNASWHRSVRRSPHEVIYGERMRSPFECVKGAPISVDDFVFQLQDRLQVIWKDCKRNNRRAREEQAKGSKTDKKRRNYVVGDYVYLTDPVLKPGRVRKFHSPWKGPYRVIEVLPPTNLKLQLQHRTVIIHQDRVKPHPSHLSIPPPPQGERRRGRPRKAISDSEWEECVDEIPFTCADRECERQRREGDSVFRPEQLFRRGRGRPRKNLPCLTNSTCPPVPPQESPNTRVEAPPSQSEPPPTPSVSEVPETPPLESTAPREEASSPDLNTEHYGESSAHPGVSEVESPRAALEYTSREERASHPTPTPLPQRSPYALRSRGPPNFPPPAREEERASYDEDSS